MKHRGSMSPAAREKAWRRYQHPTPSAAARAAAARYLKGHSATRMALDRLTSEVTAFDTLQELLQAHYTPTIRANHKGGMSVKYFAKVKALADIYDAAQKLRGDNRLAFRG